MQVKNLEVTAIVLNKVDHKTHRLSLNINFSDGSSLPMEMILEENFNLLIEKLLKQVKNMKKSYEDNDDFLPNISIVNIKNEDDIKEKAPKRLYVLDRRLDTLKQTKHYKDYMNLFSQISTAQDVIYEK
ncbi:hypothetical protein J4230_00055 [Candidatus Woesearchaeota archaeon]|nr:hypothetical protein [Candidatus Woesearchaeota archaeon]